MRDHGLTWFTFVLVAWFTYAAVLVVKAVGKPREPITRSVAIGTIVVTVVMVVGVAVVGA